MVRCSLEVWTLITAAFSVSIQRMQWDWARRLSGQLSWQQQPEAQTVSAPALSCTSHTRWLSQFRCGPFSEQQGPDCVAPLLYIFRISVQVVKTKVTFWPCRHVSPLRDFIHVELVIHTVPLMSREGHVECVKSDVASKRCSHGFQVQRL